MWMVLTAWILRKDIALIVTEDMTTSEVRRCFRSRPSVQTIHNWSLRGILVRGERIRLPRHREGGRYVFKRSEVEEFLRRLN